MNTPFTFVFFGIVGSGKGTQVELLEKYLKEKDPSAEVIFLSPGAEFRKLIQSGTYTGGLIRYKQENGFLQPDFLTNSVFVNFLLQNFKENVHLMADGYPRSVSQAETFFNAMEFYNRTDVKVIYIEVSKEEAIKRMKLRARSDDTDEGIANRFDEYVNNVIPAMNYFRDKNGYTLYSINGEQSVDEVHKELISKLGL